MKEYTRGRHVYIGQEWNWWYENTEPRKVTKIELVKRGTKCMDDDFTFNVPAELLTFDDGAQGYVSPEFEGVLWTKTYPYGVTEEAIYYDENGL